MFQTWFQFCFMQVNFEMVVGKHILVKFEWHQTLSALNYMIKRKNITWIFMQFQNYDFGRQNYIDIALAIQAVCTKNAHFMAFFQRLWANLTDYHFCPGSSGANKLRLSNKNLKILLYMAKWIYAPKLTFHTDKTPWYCWNSSYFYSKNSNY